MLIYPSDRADREGEMLIWRRAMPRRNYKIFDWKEGETIDDALDDVDNNARINVLGIEKSNEGGERILFEVIDDKNLDHPVLFEVAVDTKGTIIGFKTFVEFRLYSNIKVEDSKYKGEVSPTVVHVMGNDLGETLYGILVRHAQDANKDFKIEVTVHPAEELSYIPGDPFEENDEGDANLPFLSD